MPHGPTPPEQIIEMTAATPECVFIRTDRFKIYRGYETDTGSWIWREIEYPKFIS